MYEIFSTTITLKDFGEIIADINLFSARKVRLLMPFGFDDFASQFRHFASQSAAQWPSLKEGEIKPGLGNMAPQSNIEDEKENIHSSEMMFSGGFRDASSPPLLFASGEMMEFHLFSLLPGN